MSKKFKKFSKDQRDAIYNTLKNILVFSEKNQELDMQMEVLKLDIPQINLNVLSLLKERINDPEKLERIFSTEIDLIEQKYNFTHLDIRHTIYQMGFLFIR